MVYTKTIIHLSVGESGGYLPPFGELLLNIPNGESRQVTDRYSVRKYVRFGGSGFGNMGTLSSDSS